MFVPVEKTKYMEVRRVTIIQRCEKHICFVLAMRGVGYSERACEFFVYGMGDFFAYVRVLVEEHRNGR